MRVPVAEDDEGLRDVLVLGLTDTGYRVDAVERGDDAIDDLKWYECDVAVIDWRMPGAAGRPPQPGRVPSRRARRPACMPDRRLPRGAATSTARTRGPARYTRSMDHVRHADGDAAMRDRGAARRREDRTGTVEPAPRPPEPALPVRLGVEALGAFALTFVAAGADTAARLSGGEVTDLARAIAPGLLVMAFVYALGDRSGAHFNPAVTMAFTLRRLFPATLAAPYALAQLGGAIVAALVLHAIYGAAARAGVTQPKLVDPQTAVVLEAMLTGILVTVILGTADRARVVGPSAAIAVGATISLCGLIALPVEGASMNPARSTGPALVAGDLGALWIYWVGPLAGAAVAAAVSRLLHGPARPDEEARAAATGRDEQRESGDAEPPPRRRASTL